MGDEGRKEGSHDDGNSGQWNGVIAWVSVLNNLVANSFHFLWTAGIFASASIMGGYLGPSGAAQLLEAAGVEHIQTGVVEPALAPVAPEEKPEGEEAV